MNILCACEESQAVTIELRRLGHWAFSADILECSGGRPEWHLQGDVLEVLNCGWDMVIGFPPCTFLSNAGAVRLYPTKGVLNLERYAKGLEAKDFFDKILHCGAPRVAVENPVPSRVYGLPEKSQVIQPYEFGDPYRKKTYLWTKGLPDLVPSHCLSDFETITSWVDGGSRTIKGDKRKGVSMGHRDPKIRSRTFPGIARAMAEQWAGVCA